MISVDNMTKYYGSHVLFDNICFKLNRNEKVGMVGRNGHGKTTFFRLITGEVQPDSGTVTVPKNYRTGYVKQKIEFKEDTVLKEGIRGLCEAEHDSHWKVEKVLAGLGFSSADMEKNPNEFSGGYQVRLNLAKVLVSEPDLLLLDEPTNYLDIASIRWIEKFLAAWPRELMLITHDRGFMDKVVTHTIGIYHKKIRRVSGNTEKYYSQIAQEEEVYEKTRINDERKKKETELFINRFRAKARLAGMVQSRIKALAKIDNHKKIEKSKPPEFVFKNKPIKGKNLLEARNLSFSYGKDKLLINQFDIFVKKHERICVVGKNGKGKTTLLKLIAGKLVSQSGEISYNPNLLPGFFEQTNIQNLDNSKTVLEEILYSHPDMEIQGARNVCGAMMFEGAAALKKIGVLSGGEKSRVMLGKLIATPANLLILDEPTNHLDMESCDALLAAINAFEGAVIMVTHNEMFLHAIAKRLIVFKNDCIEVFEGSYQEFLEKEGWDEDNLSLKPDVKHVPNDVLYKKLTKKEIRKKRSEIIIEKGKALKPLEKKIAVNEDRIDKREKEIDALNSEILEASENKDGKKIADIALSLHVCKKDMDNLFDELEKLYDTLEKEKNIFEEKLVQLEDMQALIIQ